MKSINKRYLLPAFVFLPLIAGLWIYITGRKDPILFLSWLNIEHAGTNQWYAGWIPDYLWCFSLWMSMVWLWDGWNKIPGYWKWTLALLMPATEGMQYMGWMSGTADWLDVGMYLLALLTVYLLCKKIKL